MADFNDYNYFDKKIAASEGTEHVRENKREDKKKVEGYEPNPRDKDYYEAMGIKNSFDNLSVGFDREGQALISVNSFKEPGAPTLNSDRKVLKGSRRVSKKQLYGSLYFNSASRQDGAFAFSADKKMTDTRLYNEFKQAAENRVSLRQRDAVPFLRLDEDKEELSELRGKSASTNEGLEERAKLEKRVRRENEYKDRFMMRLRLAVRKNLLQSKAEEQADIKTLNMQAENADGDENTSPEDEKNAENGENTEK